MTTDKIVLWETRLALEIGELDTKPDKLLKIWESQKKLSSSAKQCTMQHAFVLVPHECCTARACVVAGVRLFFVLSLRLVQGGWEGALRGARLLFFWLEPWPTARSHVGVLGSFRVLATSRLSLPVHVSAVSPRELTGTAAL